METRLIFHTPSCRRLLLIFSGWSTPPGFYSALRAEGWDIMLVYDYTSTDFDISVLERYATVFVIAWSLGVAAAETAARLHFRRGQVSAAFAVNGTLTPADDDCGIPTAIYDGTAGRLDMRNLRRFRHRMSGARDPYVFPEDSPAEISEAERLSEDMLIGRLRHELATLRRPLPPPPAAGSPLHWKRAYISDADLIFPPAAQRRSWSGHPDRPQIIEVRGGHYVPLQDVIRDVTPDLTRIGQRFLKAAATYHDNATAQNAIAARLAEFGTSGLNRDADMSILEIGPGSGALTRHLGRLLKPAKATFIDLYPLPRFGIAPWEKYAVADAEEWLEKNHGDSGYSLIASASTIQWFADPERFFANAASRLVPGGRLVCSTYLPGNLAELDSLRPAPLIYRTRAELSEMLLRHFPHVTLEEDEITLQFDSPRQALMHLKLTGVGGGSRAMARHLLTTLPPKPRLTYRPLYILAVSK